MTINQTLLAIKFKFPSMEELLLKWYKGQMSLSEIADKLSHFIDDQNVTHVTVRNWMINYNIPRRSRGGANNFNGNVKKVKGEIR